MIKLLFVCSQILSTFPTMTLHCNERYSTVTARLRWSTRKQAHGTTKAYHDKESGSLLAKDTCNPNKTLFNLRQVQPPGSHEVSSLALL